MKLWGDWDGGCSNDHLTPAAPKSARLDFALTLTAFVAGVDAMTEGAKK